MILPQESKLAYLNWKYWNKNVNYIFYKLESWLAAIKMCRSYIEKEERRRADLGIDVATAPLSLTDNSELVQKGNACSSV